MKTLSACLIIKNEELVIERCLLSIMPICDEIIIVDTGSIDNTISIVEKMMAKNNNIKLFHFKWQHDFSKARNFSFKNATKDYVMWVDADEVFTNKLSNEILKLKQNNFNGYDIITTSIQFYYNDNKFSYVTRKRILLRTNYPYWDYRVHELLVDNTVKSDDKITEYAIPLTDGYVFHEKKKESNFNYYFQIYCDEINKNQCSESHHNLYYLIWTSYHYDKFISKKYVFNLFMHLPLHQLDIDYRTWFQNNITNKSEYEMLKTLSFFKPSLVNTGYYDKEINTNMIFIFNEAKRLYYENEKFAAYYGLKFIIDNSLYFRDFKKYEESIFEYIAIILWDINMINEFMNIVNAFFKKYPNNKIAIQNNNFCEIIKTKMKNVTMVINNVDEWKLPHILYMANNSPIGKKIIITNNSAIDLNNQDDSVTVLTCKEELNYNQKQYYFCLNDSSKINTDYFINIIKKFCTSTDNNFEFIDKNCIFTTKKENLINFF